MRFIDKLRSFFYGRYGIDGLYYALMCVFLVLWIARLFTANTVVSVILLVLQLAAVFWMFFRCLSKNIYARRRENEFFKKIFRSIKNFFVLQKNRIRDRKDYRYRKCPHCKAMLRLPKREGTHTVKCPRCSKRFEVKV